MFVVLVKGKQDYVIRNYSLAHTLAFYQEGSLLKEDFAILKPCTYRAFAFPDPDAPRDLRGRILGAGSDFVVRYDMDDTSGVGQKQGLTLPGKRLLLDVEFNMTGGQRVLSIRDHDESAPRCRVRDRAALCQSAKSVGISSALNGLHLDLFLAGFHVCLVDTFLPSPQELLGITVDYVQIQKVPNEKTATLEVHNLQVDEFGEGRTIFGPAASGLNSQQSPEAELSGFRAQPLLRIAVRGPRLLKNALYDSERQLVNLQNVAINLQPLEAPRLDVGRLLSIALRLESWTKALDLREASTAQTAAKALLKVMRRGISAPRKGGMVICYVGRLVVMPIVLEAGLVLKKRQKRGSDDDDDDGVGLEKQLLRLSARLSPGPRAIVSFVAKLATTFAEASPRFRFSKLDKRIDPQNSAVLVSAISKHYVKQLQWQVAGVLGSLQVLGDPAGLFHDVTEGFEQFFVKSIQELQGERSTVGSGVQDLVGGTVGGVVGSVATISGSVKDALGTVAGGPIGEEKRAESIGEGIEMSLASLAGGFTEALTGLVEQPLEGWDENGAVGLVKGSAQGVIGVVARPIEGVLGAAEKIAQGVEGQVRGASRSYCGLRRPPRVNFGAGERERGVASLQVLSRAFFWPKWRLRLITFCSSALPARPLDGAQDQVCDHLPRPRGRAGREQPARAAGRGAGQLGARQHPRGLGPVRRRQLADGRRGAGG
ncbi:unnamed protein product [Prorocentrum cordatum]|uniref:Vacuolar protein sorting-associated protein 13 DH-like domain-containing protein n=1 Tax=Prorocentrum cordatum TaxID=2364126 RepID=A0ABN9Y0C1_9DINO|nr:unnamed protein product [Polarella glacialis]